MNRWLTSTACSMGYEKGCEGLSFDTLSTTMRHGCTHAKRPLSVHNLVPEGTDLVCSGNTWSDFPRWGDTGISSEVSSEQSAVDVQGVTAHWASCLNCSHPLLRMLPYSQNRGRGRIQRATKYAPHRGATSPHLFIASALLRSHIKSCQSTQHAEPASASDHSGGWGR